MPIIENVTKAAQCAGLLLSDLQAANNSGDAMLSLLVLPEIENVTAIQARLFAILEAVQVSRPKPETEPGQSPAP